MKQINNTKMSEEDFIAILENRLERTRYILAVKAKEYARNNDRMHNFNRAAEMRRKPREERLQSMADKHWISILDMVDDIENGELPTLKYMDEKIGDAINYLILLEASICDKLTKIEGQTNPFDQLNK